MAGASGPWREENWRPAPPPPRPRRRSQARPGRNAAGGGGARGPAVNPAARRCSTSPARRVGGGELVEGGGGSGAGGNAATAAGPDTPRNRRVAQGRGARGHPRGIVTCEALFSSSPSRGGVRWGWVYNTRKVAWISSTMTTN